MSNQHKKLTPSLDFDETWYTPSLYQVISPQGLLTMFLAWLPEHSLPNFCCLMLPSWAQLWLCLSLWDKTCATSQLIRCPIERYIESVKLGSKVIPWIVYLYVLRKWILHKFLVRLPQLFLLMYFESGFGIEMGLQDIESWITYSYVSHWPILPTLSCYV